MRNLTYLAVLTLLATPGFAQAGQMVSADTVAALRQMAIAAGQASSSRTETVPANDTAQSAQREPIDRHRASFVARSYPGDRDTVTAHQTEEAAALPLTNSWQPTRTGQLRLSIPVDIAPTVDSGAVTALRRLAVDAGQTSRSSSQAPGGAASATEAEQTAIQDHRTAFFARTFGGGPVM